MATLPRFGPLLILQSRFGVGDGGEPAPSETSWTHNGRHATMAAIHRSVGVLAPGALRGGIAA